MALDFSALLNKPTSEIKKPPVLNDGIYYGTLGKMELVESGQKKTPGAEFQVTLTHAADGVDLIDEETGEAIELNGKVVRTTFWLSDAAQFQVVEFAQKSGIDTEGSTLGQILPQLTGLPCMVEITKVPNKDQTRMVNNVGRCSPVE